jgi:hypothetical protein
MKVLFEMGLILLSVYIRTHCKTSLPPAAISDIAGIFVQVFGHTQDRNWSPLDFQTDTSGIAYLCPPPMVMQFEWR